MLLNKRIVKIINELENKNNDCIPFYFVCRCGFNTDNLNKCEQHCKKYVRRGNCLLALKKKRI